jgi:hypothetical protein
MSCTNLNMQWKCIKPKPKPKPKPQPPKCGDSAGDDCAKSKCCDGTLQCVDSKCSYPCGNKVQSSCKLSQCCSDNMKCISDKCK